MNKKIQEFGVSDEMLFYTLETIYGYSENLPTPQEYHRYDIHWDEPVLIACYTNEHGYKIFSKHKFHLFAEIAKNAKQTIGFANVCYSDKVLAKAGISVETNYDLYDEINKQLGKSTLFAHSQYFRKQQLALYARNNVPFFRSFVKGRVDGYWSDYKMTEIKYSCLGQLNLIVQLFQRKNLLYDVDGNIFVSLPCTDLEKKLHPEIFN